MSNIYASLVKSKNGYPSGVEPLKNLLYSMRGVKQHSEELLSLSKDEEMSKDILKISKELIGVFSKYYKPLNMELKSKIEELRDFYKSEGDNSMVDYYESVLKDMR